MLAYPTPVDPLRPVRALFRFLAVLGIAARRWLAPRTAVLAAALSFHALLALAPSLLVLLAVAGRLLGQEEARRRLAEAAVRFAGPRADAVVSALLDPLTTRGHTTGTVVGLTLMMLFGSTFFVRFRMALDAVWEVRDKRLVRQILLRAISYVETLLAVAVSVVVLALGTLGSIVGPVLSRLAIGGAAAWSAWTRLGALVVTALFLATAFRYIPHVRPRPRWGSTLTGAVPAALALHLANEFLGWVVARNALVSLYGAAGTVIVVLLWVYYSAFIVLFGAEVSRAWQERASM